MMVNIHLEYGIEPGGQSIKIGGIINDPNVGYYASFGDPQWCLHACSWGLPPGYVDPNRVYKMLMI